MFRHKYLRLGEGNTRLRKVDLDWFRLEKYKPIASYSRSDWVNALNVRYEAFVRFADDTFILSDQAALELLADPLGPRGQKPSTVEIVHDEDYQEDGPIEDLRIVDLIGTLKSSDASKIVSDLNTFASWEAGPRTKGPPDMKSATRTYRSWIDSDAESPALPIWVDLNADDELLMRKFRDWISAARTQFGPGHRAISWSDRSMQSWVDFQVLPFIDLNIFCSRVKGQLTQRLAGSLLFPDEVDVDLTERIRKVVVPLAERLLADDFLSALARHVQGAPEQEVSRDPSGT